VGIAKITAAERKAKQIGLVIILAFSFSRMQMTIWVKDTATKIPKRM
jgi:hypothetical protein